MFLVFLFEVVVFVFFYLASSQYEKITTIYGKPKTQTLIKTIKSFFGLCIGRLHNKEELMTIYREPNSKVIENIFKHMLFVVQSLINDKCA